MSTLKQAIGLPTATALVVGTIIGSSIFVQASEITSLVPRSQARHPRLGGRRRAHADRRAGLRRAVVGISRGPAASTSSSRRSIRRRSASSGAGRCSGRCTAASWRRSQRCSRAMRGTSCRSDVTGSRLVAIGAIVVLSAINYLGVQLRQRPAVRVHAGEGARGVGDHRARVRALMRDASSHGRRRHRRHPGRPVIPLANFLLAVGAGLFAFGGWHMVTYTAERDGRSRREPSRVR